MKLFFILSISLITVNSQQYSGLNINMKCNPESTKNLLTITGFSDKCINYALTECNDSYHVNKKFDDPANVNEFMGQLQTSGISPKCLSAALRDCYNDDSNSKPCTNSYSSASEIKSRTCADLLKNGDKTSGLKTIYPWRAYPSIPETVYCDQVTDGGGWTVIQRRQVGQVREDFYRTWVEYSLGFGNKDTEFWLGNDLISEITSLELNQLRIMLKDEINDTRWAKYDYFHVGDKSTNYILHAGRYTGNAGDGLGIDSGRHNGHVFTTKDRHNDKHDENCAKLYKGGWWYDKCHISNLNGLPHKGHHDQYAEGINWHPWLGYHESLTYTIMMIKPMY